MKRARFWPVLLAASALGAACENQVSPAATPRMPEPTDRTAEIVSPSQAIRRADIAAIDPAELGRAEIEKALGPGTGCNFRYAREGGPVLAVRGSEGVVKLNGELVLLRADGAPGGGLRAPAAGPVMVAEGIRIAVTPLEPPGSQFARRLARSDAEMVFELADGLRAGYRGFYACDDEES